jgi:carboxyl-terminal processing protease
MKIRITTALKALLTVLGIVYAFVLGYSWNNVLNPPALWHDIVHLPDRVFAASQTDTTKGMRTIDTYSDVLAKMEQRCYKPVDKLQITYAAVSGMMGGLDDPYTRFMTPSAWKAMQEDTRGDYVGVGATLDPSPLGAIIKRPLPNSPSSHAGIESGDLIVAVDGKPVAGVDIDEIIHMIRGEEGTKVQLRIQRTLSSGQHKTLEYNLVRSRVDLPTVEHRVLKADPRIGYVYITEFNEKADSMLSDALADLQKKKVRALVVDVRDNPGGLLDEAVSVAGRFLKDKSVVIVRDRSGEEQSIHTRAEDYIGHKYPIAVLINGRSASASEIVSGALQDHRAATLVGEKSFGKGLVQTLITLGDDSAIAITTQRYFTPSHRDINAKRCPDGTRVGGGLIPDVEVEQNPDYKFGDDTTDTQLKKAVEVLRKQLASGK